MSILAWNRFCMISLETIFLTCFFSSAKKLARFSKLNERYCFAALNKKESIAARLNAKSSVYCSCPLSYSGIRVIALIL